MSLVSGASARPEDRIAEVLARIDALRPERIVMGLAPMRRLDSALGHPTQAAHGVVMIAGTNGKGSTLTILRAIAEAAGLSVHSYMSPGAGLYAQVRLDGAPPARAAILDALEAVEAANAGAPLTRFEAETMAAFLLFAGEPEADLRLVEVGMGGDDDATNIYDENKVFASVITPIDLDHQAFLGPDIASIARRKAGVARWGRDLILAPQRPDVEAVLLEEAERIGVSRVWRHGVDWAVEPMAAGFTFTWRGRMRKFPKPGLPGPHQILNAGLALAAMEALRLPVLAKEARAGVKAAHLPLRFEAVDPAAYGLPSAWRVMRDGAHNPHAARALAATIAEERRDEETLVLIPALRADKDAEGFLAAFAALHPLILPARRDGDDPARLRAAVDSAGLAMLDSAPAGPVLAVICGSLERIRIDGCPRSRRDDPVNAQGGDDGLGTPLAEGR